MAGHDDGSKEATQATVSSGKTGDGTAPKIDPRLLEILVCPLTKGPLEYKVDAHELVSHRADLAFPIRNGVPLLTPDAARELSDAERAHAKATKR